MKKLSTKPVSYITSNGAVECPHCQSSQEHIEEYSADEVYECEVCWSHYTVPMFLIEKAQAQEERIERVTQAELSALEKRIIKLEKELGIKK